MSVFLSMTLAHPHFAGICNINNSYLEDLPQEKKKREQIEEGRARGRSVSQSSTFLPPYMDKTTGAHLPINIVHTNTHKYRIHQSTNSHFRIPDPFLRVVISNKSPSVVLPLQETWPENHSCTHPSLQASVCLLFSSQSLFGLVTTTPPRILSV